ncbi:FliH/SctL family protein [Leifsonia sp. LS-T14]|uniref:FliH/SctL family protein n=1 Tax=unclassified Leifsonia TaxID=2663824 RepID=UPI0035A65A66
MSSDAALAFEPLAVPVLTETDHERAAMATARSRGYAAGFAEGRRAAAQEQALWMAQAEDARAVESAEAADRVAVLVTALRGAAIELREATVPVLADAESALVEAAFELAGVVVGVALHDRVAAARAAVDRVISAVDGGAVPAIRLHPDDLGILRGMGHVGDEVRLIPDPTLSPGDAIGELPNGWLDARIHQALERAKEALS